MDRLDSMKLLLDVVKAGSLSAAGRELRQPLATVSRKISDLESHLGARLLNRSKRQMTLTEAGVAYVRSIGRILEDLYAAERAAAGEYQSARGELVMTAPLVFGRLHVLPVVTRFLQSFPEISIRLFLADRIINLEDDHVDIAVRIGNLPDSSLKALRLGSINTLVCASPDYLARHPPLLSPDDLAAHSVINFAAINTPDRWTLGSGARQTTVAIKTRLHVNTAEAALDACVAGLGLTRVLSYQAAAALKAGTLIRVLPEWEGATLPVHLVYADQGTMPHKLRVFVDFAMQALKNSF